MNWSRFKHDTKRNVLGKSKWPTVVGTLVAAAYTITVMIVPYDVNSEFFPYLGAPLGGLVAGAILGTNVYDGFMYGFRAGAYGMVIVSFVAAIGSFVLFFRATGQTYFYFSSFIGLVAVFVITPIFGFVGAFGGALGTITRRTVVPKRYNPPVR